MKLSKKDAARVQGNGWWVAPDNTVYPVPQDAGGHRGWLEQNWEKVKKFDDTVIQNDPQIWLKAFMKSWIRIRIEFDESDMSKPITSMSCVDIDLLDTVPEAMKDVIAQTDRLEFIDMNTAATQIYPKEKLLQMLHRRRKASLKLSARDGKEKFSKYEFRKIPLNSVEWGKLYKSIISALKRWNELDESIQPWDIAEYRNKEKYMSREMIEEINKLYSYYRTDSGMPGGEMNPLLKFMTLRHDKTFEKILDALDRADSKRNQMLEEEQEQNISEADKIQRADELMR